MTMSGGAAQAKLLANAFVHLRWTKVWHRHALVWRKLMGPALLGNIGEPLLYLLALGYGLGTLVGDLQGMDYVTFLASGFVCASAMNTASFEGLYSAYTRMAVQETWTAMLFTPLSLEDVILGETVWAASKSVLSATAILLVATGLGAVHGWAALWVLPVAFLTGLAFAAMALMVTAVARNYDFFLYYFTLLLTPMLLLSGVFFPLDGMPLFIQQAARALPLAHAIELVRPLMVGQAPSNPGLHLLVIGFYSVVSVYFATILLRRRVLR